MRKKTDGKGMEGAGETVFYDSRDKQSGGVYTARGLRYRGEEVLHLRPEGVDDHGGEA